MGSWTEKFRDGLEIHNFGYEMVRFLERIKPFVTDEKLKRKIRKKQLMFLENPDELSFYEKGKKK